VAVPKPHLESDSDVRDPDARRHEVLVVGAGVIGLTSALCLAENGLRVRVRAAAPPQQTTSRVASAIWASAPTEPAADLRRWAGESLERFRALADTPDTGVHLAPGTLASRRSTEPPSPARFPEVEISRIDRVPDGFLAAFAAELPLIDMPRYLGYLSARLADADVPIEISPVPKLAGMAERGATVVNCTGIGARELVSDPELRPVRGEHVVLENPGVEHFFLEEPRGEEWTSFFPHGERIVLGGTAREDDWSLDPDPGCGQAILERCARVEPLLGSARVIEHQVGLRPVRPVVRVECEQLYGATLIHNYGHGANGVSLSWGCAHDVVALALAR
jgi:D-amino-acid oxidase